VAADIDDATTPPDRQGIALPSGSFPTGFILGYYAVSHCARQSSLVKGSSVFKFIECGVHPGCDENLSTYNGGEYGVG